MGIRVNSGEAVTRLDHDGGIHFGHLYVVSELYKDFLHTFAVPPSSGGFHIHHHAIPSRYNDILRLLESPDGPLIVETPLATAADILAQHGQFRMIGATYLMSSDVEKCALYHTAPLNCHWNEGGIQLFLHTGEESIVTIMADAWFWNGENDQLCYPGCSDQIARLGMLDYAAISNFVRQLLGRPLQEQQVRVAFVLSGEENRRFQEQYSTLDCVPNLTSCFFSYAENTNIRYSELRKGIPGTILLTRESDIELADSRERLQDFVDKWYAYVGVGSISPTIMEKLHDFGFNPLPWARPEHIERAILFTEFVKESFGNRKLRSDKSLQVNRYVPILPREMSSAANVRKACSNFQTNPGLHTLKELENELWGNNAAYYVKPTLSVEHEDLDGHARHSSVKLPSDRAFATWRCQKLLGISKQTEIAKKMIQEGFSTSQGQVSKDLKDVEAFLKAGGQIPETSKSLTKPQSVDPQVISMGARQDGLTQRQRGRRDPDSDAE